MGSNIGSTLSVNTAAYPQANIKLNVRYEIDFQYYGLFLQYGLNNAAYSNSITFNTAVNDNVITDLRSVESGKTSNFSVSKSCQVSIKTNTTFNVTTTMAGPSNVSTFWRYENGTTKYGSVISGYYEILMDDKRVYKSINAFEAKLNSGPNGMANTYTLRYMFTLSGEFWNLYNSFGDDKPDEITVNICMSGKPYSI